MAAPVIWINALPGTGEDAVVDALNYLYRPLSIIFSPKRMRSRECVPPRKNRLQTPQSRFREACWIESFNHKIPERNIIVVVDFHLNNERGQMIAHECRSAARESSRPFIPVYLYHSRLKSFTDAILPAYIYYGGRDNSRRAFHDEGLVHTDTTQARGLIGLGEPSCRRQLFRFQECYCPGLYFCTNSMDPRPIAQTIISRCRERHFTG
ncbi:hypothetical protein PT974_03785 [Cladobotryum mycophilum]|uniref:Uncharacterized protein n=1 Tax=Cladobotryum mycophilum TaxID=491253 RepID=A0ABR0ST95_9HYPO